MPEMVCRFHQHQVQQPLDCRFVRAFDNCFVQVVDARDKLPVFLVDFRNADDHRYLQSVSAASTEAAASLLEVENGVLVSEMVARSALMREESRGGHFRSDFPAEDASWKKNLFVQKVNDQVLIR